MNLLPMFVGLWLSRDLREAADDIEFINDRYAWHAIVGKRRVSYA